MLRRIFRIVQQSLLPALEAETGPPSEPSKQRVRVVELADSGRYPAPERPNIPGRTPENRPAPLTALVAKAVYNPATPRALIERVDADPALRRYCRRDGHCGSRTGEARAQARARRAEGAGRARPRSGSRSIRAGRPAVPPGRTLKGNWADPPAGCDRGGKKEGKGHATHWIGYKADRNWSGADSKNAMDPAQREWCKDGTTDERGHSGLKDNYGWRFVRVRGAVQVAAHLSFGLIALAAERLFGMLVK